MARHPDFDPRYRLNAAKAGLLDLIAINARIATEADRALQHAVASARYAGVTWDDIGELLGTSRQNAWKRFHRAVGMDDQLDAAPAQSEGEKRR